MKYFIFSISLHLLIGVVVFGAAIKRREALTPVLSQQQVFVEIIQASEEKNPSPLNTKNKLTKIKSIPKDEFGDVQDFKKIEKDEDYKVSQKNATDPVTLSYTQELKNYLEKSKRYPRQAMRLKQSGVVEVQVKIDAGGAFSEIKLSKASTFTLLDQAAVSLLKKIGSFKPLPKSITPNSNFTIPIAYVMGQVR